MRRNYFNPIPAILAVIGLIANLMGIYTFLNLGYTPEGPNWAVQNFNIVFQFIFFYVGIVVVWCDLNRLGRPLGDINTDFKPYLSIVLYGLFVFPFQWLVTGAFLIIVPHFFELCIIGLTAHFLYLWQHSKD